jgi:hypothetical protein
MDANAISVLCRVDLHTADFGRVRIFRSPHGKRRTFRPPYIRPWCRPCTIILYFCACIREAAPREVAPNMAGSEEGYDPDAYYYYDDDGGWMMV